ncbi:MAG: 2-phospho-L-lactate guanylyltransferase [Anaerolineae bacterium]|jgi:2-phospho-L-lactate guanylyltransferase|nr:2-phospho-L-lactate guanylyltransferase [Anaerolineae bacterium]
MTVWAVIPVKPLNRAKSRLEKVLSPEQRHDLATMMFRQVLSVTTATPQITGTMVISRDTRAIGIAREFGAKTIQESSYSDLNPALERATGVIRAWRAGAMLILPADLPFITAADLAAVVNRGHDISSIVIATDHHRNGTNVLLVRPPGLIGYAYGPGSFERHLAMAAQVRAQVSLYESEQTLLDIDEPDDLEQYNLRVESGHYEYLKPFLSLTT